MGGFKLIGIQVLDGCMYHVRKLLPVKELYKFYANYHFEQDESKYVTSIEVDETEDVKFYNIKRNNKEELLVSISAMVGKNGSGKSTILELFYTFCLCISKDQDDIKKELEKINNITPSKRKRIQIAFDNVHVEVFYENMGVLRSIRYEGAKGLTAFVFVPERREDKAFDLANFCYTIALNYSIYGLNEINTPWLTPMFHKNDGYQAPLVINPFRRKGNINVMREYDLTNARLIQNISLYSEPNPDIINGQRLDRIKFSFEPRKLERIEYSGNEYDLNETINHYESSTGKSIYDLFNRLSKELVNEVIPAGIVAVFNQLKRNGVQSNIVNYKKDVNSGVNISPYIEFWFVRYIIKKVFKICLLYSWFREKYVEFTTYNEHDVIAIKMDSEPELLSHLLKDKSHVTLKLRQTIFMWKQRFFLDKVNWVTVNHEDDPEYFACACHVNATQLVKATGDLSIGRTLKENIDLEKIPGGILKPDILVSKVSTNNLEGEIEKLSSGEQQQLFTIQSIIYHLKNIDSVFETNHADQNEILKYSNVLIILDEVELYFHPEFQRIFIFELLRQIGQINIDHIKSICILFSTHSPFLLSDIKASSIMKIDEGIGQPYVENEQTFGANLHDLLANDFYLKDGFMGKYAEFIINDLANYLTYEKDTDEKYMRDWDEPTARKTIFSMGEPLLKVQMERLFDKKFVEPDQDLIRRRIQELQAKLHS